LKQVLQHARTGELSVESVPAPQLLPGCVLVRIGASVVSAGTERASAEFARKSLVQKARSRPDLVRDVISKVQRDGIFSAIQTVRSRLDQPQVPGYSSAGTVIAVGEGVTDLKPGDRVACAGAGIAVHAEVACVPRLLAARIEGDVTFDEAAFATLGAVALHGLRTAEVKLGDMVGVIGLGLLGQLTVQLLRAAGCRVIGMDIDAARADLARQSGADAVANSSGRFMDIAREMSGGAGMDSVLVTAETSSSDPVNLAGVVARDRAIVVAVGTVGIDIQRKAYYEKELDFRISRSYGPGRYDAAYEQKGRDYPIGYVRWTETRNMEAFLRLLADRKVSLGLLITHRFPIDKASAAYDLITGRTTEPFLGVVIRYPESTDIGQTISCVAEQPRRHNGTGANSEVSVGVLGAGIFATGTLIPALKASSETILTSICAATGAHAKHAARKFGFRSCTTDEAQVVRDAAINTLVIATRHHLHADQVLRGIDAGKNIFCEKPLCLTEDQLHAIAAAYLGAPRRRALMVGFNRRFAPMVGQLKPFLSSISEPLSFHYRINAGDLPPDHWINDREQGGGRVLSEVCHFVDLLTFLAGSTVVEVEARAAGGAGRSSGGNVQATLFFANGTQGTISYLAGGDRSFPKERLEVFGGGAVAVLDDFRRLELVRNGRKQSVRSRWRQDKGHHGEWAAFVQAVRQESESPISFEDIVCTTLATLRIEESVRTGERLVVNSGSFLHRPPQPARVIPA